MKKELKMWLEKRFGNMVRFDEPMSGHTTFGIGGPAHIVTVKTDQQIKDLVLWSREHDQPLMILGAGSNLLVRDGGIRGVVVRLADGFTSIDKSAEDVSAEGVKVVAGAGALLPNLCRYALDQGLAGLNFALSIPGTIGGAIRMNAGAWGKRMSEILSAIVILNRHGDIESVPRDRLEFSYRTLKLENDAIILRGEFLLHEADPIALRKEARELLKKRHSTQPVSAASAGCFFKNPAKGPSAGELIEQAGLKGIRVGNAQISRSHANFVVNKGGATAADVISLARAAQDRVYERFGIQLQREVIVVGEEETSKKLL